MYKQGGLDSVCVYSLVGGSDSERSKFRLGDSVGIPVEFLSPSGHARIVILKAFLILRVSSSI